MAGVSAAQAEWVSRVLGIAPLAAPVAGDFASRWSQARSRYEAASETVDSQIGKLQQALRASPDEDLQAIGEFGLNGITGNHRVRIMAGMRDVESSGGAAEARAKLAGLLDAYGKHLATEEKIMACDENPLGVAVSIRATLGAALDGLRAALA